VRETGRVGGKIEIGLIFFIESHKKIFNGPCSKNFHQVFHRILIQKILPGKNRRVYLYPANLCGSSGTVFFSFFNEDEPRRGSMTKNKNARNFFCPSVPRRNPDARNRVILFFASGANSRSIAFKQSKNFQPDLMEK